MKIQTIFAVPNFRELDKIGKTIFILSFVLPLAIIYTFLHLYFLPFGLDVDYELNSREVEYANRDFFYTVEDEEVLDGIAEIQVNPRIAKRNPIVTASVQGDGTYIIPPRFSSKDLLFEPTYEVEFNEEFIYSLLQEYEVENEEIVVFKINYEVDWETQENNTLLLKYQNIRIIQNKESVTLRADKILENELETFETNFPFYSEDKDSSLTIYAIYKRPTDTNGFLEIISNGRIGSRTVIPSESKEHDYRVDVETLDTKWHPELEKDLSQEFISLKQEQYTYDLIEEIPQQFRNAINLETYYEDLFKPSNLEKEEEDECYDYFEYDPDSNVREQVYYQKEFFESFEGHISRIEVGYGYPLVKKQELNTLFPTTPFILRIAGENAKIENLQINLFREPLWGKL